MKPKMESKVEHPTQSYRETSFVLPLIYGSQTKSKTVVNWSSWKKKEGIFCVLLQCIVYWIHFKNIHTFTYQKILLHIIFCLFLKSSKAFSVSLSFLSKLLYSTSNVKDKMKTMWAPDNVKKISDCLLGISERLQ